MMMMVLQFLLIWLPLCLFWFLVLCWLLKKGYGLFMFVWLMIEALLRHELGAIEAIWDLMRARDKKEAWEIFIKQFKPIDDYIGNTFVYRQLDWFSAPIDWWIRYMKLQIYLIGHPEAHRRLIRRRAWKQKNNRRIKKGRN
jgi:hypothetical protein